MKRLNDLPDTFAASIDTLDPKHKKPAASVQNAPAQAKFSAESKFLRCYTGDYKEWFNEDVSAAIASVLASLARRHRNNPVLMAEDFERSPLFLNSHWSKDGKWDRLKESELQKAVALNPRLRKESGYEGDGSDWRDGCKSKSQLTDKPPKFLLSGLIPEKALTFVTGPSYHGKTWLTVQASQSVSTKSALWCFDGPEEAVPVVYHVPEMNESLVRSRMDKLSIEDSEMFLVRTMESGIWSLDDPRMLKSAEGRLVVLDTAGYFNPADDASDYKQSLKFGEMVFNILTNGARAVVALYHPPKYAKADKEMSLENMLLGSAGYGGILRSCLGVRNLNPDLNDPNVWLYVQGLKNPGLKPFQLEGLPLRMKVPPGESPYLNTLLSSIEGHEDPRYLKACALFVQGASQRKVAEALKPIALQTVNKWHRKWKEEQEAEPQLKLQEEF